MTFAQQPAEAVEVFGKDIGMTVGVGARSVWAVLGGDESYNTLKGVMDQLEESNQTPQEFRTPPNFRVIMNINQLVEMATIADTVGKKAREAREQAAGAEATTKLENPTPSVLVDSSPGRSSEGGNGGDSGRDARRDCPAAWCGYRQAGAGRRGAGEGDDDPAVPRGGPAAGGPVDW